MVETRATYRARSELTESSLTDLLNWLSSDREAAGHKYEHIRRVLIKIFSFRGSLEPELLADETITRVANKIKSFENTYIGEPDRYFYGVAQKVFLEYSNRPKISTDGLPSRDDEEQEVKEIAAQCLESCLSKLKQKDRELVLEYYRHQERKKIDSRRVLAESQGLSLNALRIKLFEIRKLLKRCVGTCIEKEDRS